jgi:hypothetical protein
MSVNLPDRKLHFVISSYQGSCASKSGYEATCRLDLNRLGRLTAVLYVLDDALSRFVIFGALR